MLTQEIPVASKKEGTDAPPSNHLVKDYNVTIKQVRKVVTHCGVHHGELPAADVGGNVARMESDYASTLGQFTLMGSSNLPYPVDDNHSSAALLGDTGDVLVLLNRGNFPDPDPRIYVFTPAGSYLRTIRMFGFDDPEGICQLHSGSNRYAIVEEGINDDITLVTITPLTTTISKADADVYPVTLPFSKVMNKGMEGVTYDAPNDCFYVVQESYPMGVYRITLNATDTTTEVVFDAEQVFNGFATDLSDLSLQSLHWTPFHFERPCKGIV